MEYRVKLKTAPSAEPISAAEAKTHLNVTHSSDDTYIGVLITLARKLVEDETQRKLINQTWYAYYDAFPGGSELRLPFGPVSSVTALKYTDEAAVQSTLATTVYATDFVSDPARLVLKPDQQWPLDTLYPVNPIEVEFIVGYGTAGSNVPEPLIQAVKLLVGHYYEHREDVVLGYQASTPMPLVRGVNDLLRNYRIWAR